MLPPSSPREMQNPTPYVPPYPHPATRKNLAPYPRPPARREALPTYPPTSSPTPPARHKTHSIDFPPNLMVYEFSSVPPFLLNAPSLFKCALPFYGTSVPPIYKSQARTHPFSSVPPIHKCTHPSYKCTHPSQVYPPFYKCTPPVSVPAKLVCPPPFRPERTHQGHLLHPYL